MGIEQLHHILVLCQKGEMLVHNFAFFDKVVGSMAVSIFSLSLCLGALAL